MQANLGVLVILGLVPARSKCQADSEKGYKLINVIYDDKYKTNNLGANCIPLLQCKEMPPT